MGAGTRKKKKKIKGVDAFGKVCENLRRYSANGFVHLKYIILPGVNDSEADINGFIELCGNLNIKAVDVTRDRYDGRSLTDHAIGMVARMLNGLQKIGVCAYAPDYIFLTRTDERHKLNNVYREIKNA
jgi:adenine C2-methylase RlmN of 23S rRNA A2503 and tRNA A37